MRERIGAYRILVGKCEENLENSGIDGRLILRWIFRNWNSGLGGEGMDCIHLAQDKVC
jgi:hypothetical protein